MCIAQKMQIKAVHNQAPRFGFIPCGHCLECRLVSQFNWVARFRLAAQAMQQDPKIGCQVGFGTLTYNDSALPHIPKDFIKDFSPNYDNLMHGDGTPPCFSKSHIRALIKNVRDWLYDTYGIKKPVYMVCSEFGETTKRPHYHFAFAMPFYVDMHKLHQKIKDFWASQYGFICPKDFEGSKKHKIKPFVAQNLHNAIAYVCKYCCKDLAFYDSVNLDDYQKAYMEFGKWRRLSDYLPFHFQSRSLGSNYLDSLDDVKKQQLLKDGFYFVGDTKCHELPLYFKNKLLFYNEYIIKDGKRLVRRYPTKFFEENAEFVFEEKRKKYEEICKKWLSSDYWQTLTNVQHDKELEPYLNFIRNTKNYYNLTANDLSYFYLAYFGRDWNQVLISEPAYVQWFRRYWDNNDYSSYPCYCHYDKIAFGDLSALLLYALEIENKLMKRYRDDALSHDREIKALKEFHLNHF